MKRPLMSICMPTYNGSKWIKDSISSILSQGFKDFELIISDDCSTDNTVDLISKFKEHRIKIYKNNKNLGYGLNLQKATKLTNGKILFLMGQDDILVNNNVLQKTYNAFSLDKHVGAVTRPYFWFDTDPNRPVRLVTPYDSLRDRVISVFDGKREVEKIFESVGQLSGLAYKKKYLSTDFHKEIFPAHIYPFAAITKKYKIVFLKDYTVAVRIASSQTRFKPSIYDISPTESWIKMFRTIYSGYKYKLPRQAGIDQISRHYLGLVQLKNYSPFKNLFREIYILIKYRPQNVLNPTFWFFVFGTILIPKKMLIFFVDLYKNKYLANRISQKNLA